MPATTDADPARARDERRSAQVRRYADQIDEATDLLLEPATYAHFTREELLDLLQGLVMDVSDISKDPRPQVIAYRRNLLRAFVVAIRNHEASP